MILNCGTTTTAIARALGGFKNRTIITSAVNIAAELPATTLDVIPDRRHPTQELVLTGWP